MTTTGYGGSFWGGWTMMMVAHSVNMLETTILHTVNKYIVYIYELNFNIFFKR